jgi:hypothetical protein
MLAQACYLHAAQLVARAVCPPSFLHVVCSCNPAIVTIAQSCQDPLQVTYLGMLLSSSQTMLFMCDAPALGCPSDRR